MKRATPSLVSLVITLAFLAISGAQAATIKCTALDAQAFQRDKTRAPIGKLEIATETALATFTNQTNESHSLNSIDGKICGIQLANFSDLRFVDMQVTENHEKQLGYRFKAAFKWDSLSIPLFITYEGQLTYLKEENIGAFHCFPSYVDEGMPIADLIRITDCKLE